jgi:hypothetical protein
VRGAGGGAKHAGRPLRAAGLARSLSRARRLFPFSLPFFSFLERSPAPGVWNQLDKLLSYGGGGEGEGRGGGGAGSRAPRLAGRRAPTLTQAGGSGAAAGRGALGGQRSRKPRKRGPGGRGFAQPRAPPPPPSKTFLSAEAGAGPRAPHRPRPARSALGGRPGPAERRAGVGAWGLEQSPRSPRPFPGAG